MSRHTNFISILWRASIAIILTSAALFSAVSAYAEWEFQKGTADSIHRAIAWNPLDSKYYAALAHSLQYDDKINDPSQVISLFETATEISPGHFRYWTSLASAYEWNGRPNDSHRAFQHAYDLFPASPVVNWRLANFYFQDSQPEKAVAALRKVLAGAPDLHQAAFSLGWRGTQNPAYLREEMLPPDPVVFLEYIDFLSQLEEWDEARRTWDDLIAMDKQFNPRLAFPYLDALLTAERPNDLFAAWNILKESIPGLSSKGSGLQNLVNNGGFENEIINGGLSWRVSTLAGTAVSHTSLTYFDGSHALKLKFDGSRNLAYGHIYHYVQVKPLTLYHFAGYIKTKDITTDSGPRFQILDYYHPENIALTTEGLRGTTGWTLQHLEFYTGPRTRLLLVRVFRPQSLKFDNKIKGTAWIDRVSLIEIQ